MDQRTIEQLEEIAGKPNVVTTREQMENYLFDESPANDLTLVGPTNTQQVSAILQLANNHSITVFPRGNRAPHA